MEEEMLLKSEENEVYAGASDASDAQSDNLPLKNESGDALTPPATDAPDFEAMAASDLSEIKKLVPELSDVDHLGKLPFAHRFAELRELGLSVKEALYATMPTYTRENGKSHLKGSVPRGKGALLDSLSVSEMREAKDLFYGLSEAEINSLYRRVRGV